MGRRRNAARQRSRRRTPARDLLAQGTNGALWVAHTITDNNKVLVKIGLLDFRKLNSFRPYWVVLELVICAFLTPSGDPFTMLLMAVPLHLLYEISILISWYWDWKDRKRRKV